MKALEIKIKYMESTITAVHADIPSSQRLHTFEPSFATHRPHTAHPDLPVSIMRPERRQHMKCSESESTSHTNVGERCANEKRFRVNEEGLESPNPLCISTVEMKGGFGDELELQHNTSSETERVGD